MGICYSKGEDDLVNDEINSIIKKEKKREANDVKLLLLGAGESGKSTVLKQMKMIHLDGFSNEERQEFVPVIFSNAVQSMKVIVDAMDEMKMNLARPKDNQGYKALIQGTGTLIEGGVLPRDLGIAIRQLWSDSGVRQVFGRSSEYQLNDSAGYYFDAIDRLAQSDYLPTDQDILRSRLKTTGIVEARFLIDGKYTYRMFDVGGQRSERKKWIHCFESVTAIIFMVAISEYDQVLVEDEKVSRMDEALALFESICNSRWFVNTSIILFLNKTDIFREKIQRVPISRYYPDYRGGADYEQGCAYFERKFEALNASPDKKHIFTHFTCATDTGQVEFVMNAVHKIIIQNRLQSANLI